MKSTFYRLGEYKIIDSGTGALWWEAHAGLGALISGKCFIRGEIDSKPYFEVQAKAKGRPVK